MLRRGLNWTRPPETRASERLHQTVKKKNALNCTELVQTGVQQWDCTGNKRVQLSSARWESRLENESVR